MADITLKTILQALKEHSERIDGRFDRLENEVKVFQQNMEERFNHLSKKVDGIRADLTDA